jgi:hypothetical protein
LGSTYIAEKFGRSAAGRPEMLLTYEQFPEFWRKSRERLVLFARAKDVARLNRQGVALGQPILQSGDVVLLANR